MLKAVSQKAFICLRCSYRLSRLNRSLVGVRSSPFQSISQAYSNAAAAVAEEPIHEQSDLVPAKDESASQTSSRRGKRFRKSLREKKAVAAKKAAATKKAAQKRKPQTAVGSLRKPPSRSEREGANGKNSGHGQRHTTVPLGIRALGQPAKAVIVENENRTSPSLEVQHTEKSQRKTPEFEALFKTLAKEDEVLSFDEVQSAIDQLKTTYAEHGHRLVSSNWTTLRRKISDGFQAEQLRQYIKTAKENVGPPEKGQSRSTTQKGPSLHSIMNETYPNKSKIALYIMRNVWGLRPRAGKTDEELKLEPNQLQVFTHMTQDTLARLEERYRVTIDLQSDRSALSLHYEKKDDQNLTEANRKQAYERLSRLCRDLSTQVINLTSMGNTSFSVQRQLLKRSYLDHLSATRETFVEAVGFRGRHKGKPKPTEPHELRIHYLSTSHRHHSGRLVERDLNLAFHRVKQRSSIYQWWTKENQPVRIPVATPDNSTWHQKELNWARLVFPPSANNEETTSPSTLSNVVLKNLHQQTPKAVRSTSSSQDFIYLGHLLTPRIPVKDQRRPELGMTPLSTNIPLLAHALSSFRPKENDPVFSQFSEKGMQQQQQRNRALFVPSPFCAGDLPSFELQILDQASPRRDLTRFVSVTAIFHSAIIDLPLPQANCDLRYVRKYLRLLTPPGGVKWATWMGMQGDVPDNLDSYRTMQSLLTHLPQAWDEQKKQLSFPPLCDVDVPNAWVRGRDISMSEKRSPNPAESTSLHNTERASHGTEAGEGIQTSPCDAHQRSNEVPGSNCSRFPYICAASNSVNEVVYKTQPARLHLLNHYDTVSESACQELFLRGRRLPSPGSGQAEENRKGEVRTVKSMLAQALEYARTFGR